ncbi:hypothetical protein YERSI8AC_200032 [Enterobacterales bacterium 8AC]|nr:hypothetical protein YERSI8AC_200032 [Enterobacterales bacterium 8AC]
MHFSASCSDFVMAVKSYRLAKFAKYMDLSAVIPGCDSALHLSNKYPLKLIPSYC